MTTGGIRGREHWKDADASVSFIRLRHCSFVAGMRMERGKRTSGNTKVKHRELTIRDPLMAEFPCHAADATEAGATEATEDDCAGEDEKCGGTSNAEVVTADRSPKKDKTGSGDKHSIRQDSLSPSPKDDSSSDRVR